jgi:leucyl-tRNA synthetase
VTADGTARERAGGAAVTIGRVEAMSKSKRNTVDPGAIISRYGADTARWFILSDNPPERDMEWTEAGVAGAYRFTQRLFRLVEAVASGVGRASETPTDSLSAPALTLRRATHRTIAAVTEALEGFAFNVAVARLYEFSNALAEAERAAVPEDAGLAFARREAAEAMVRLTAPMMPHLAEEAYALLHPHATQLVTELPWLDPDPALLAQDSVTIAVQVMGKLRGSIRVAPDAPAETVLAAAAAEPNVARALEGRRIVKRVHVPNRIVNFVLAG